MTREGERELGNMLVKQAVKTICIIHQVQWPIGYLDEDNLHHMVPYEEEEDRRRIAPPMSDDRIRKERKDSTRLCLHCDTTSDRRSINANVQK